MNESYFDLVQTSIATRLFVIRTMYPPGTVVEDETVVVDVTDELVGIVVDVDVVDMDDPKVVQFPHADCDPSTPCSMDIQTVYDVCGCKPLNATASS